MHHCGRNLTLASSQTVYSNDNKCGWDLVASHVHSNMERGKLELVYVKQPTVQQLAGTRQSVD